MALLLNANDSVNRSYTITKPSPNHPLDVNGVGVRTENLFDGFDYFGTVPSISTGRDVQYAAGASTNFISIGSPVLTLSKNQTYTGANIFIFLYDADKQFIGATASKQITIYSTGITGYTDAKYCRIRVDQYAQYGTEYMLNTGSTPLPYEPYGYKIPISSGGVTTNIYLGSTQTVRQIKKLVLTGNENFNYAERYLRFSISIDDIKSSGVRTGRIYCSHYECLYHGEPYDNAWDNVCYQTSETLYFHDRRFNTIAGFTAYLSSQYAAGTPVTIWYALATPQTATVNEPLMKIGDYADTLSNATAIPTTEGANSITVDTTVQPSEFTATWTGWHNAGVKEKSENLFDISVLAYPYDLDISTGLPVYRPDSAIIRTVTTAPIDVTGLTQVTLTYSSTVTNTLFIYSIFNNDTLIKGVANKSSGYTISLNGANKLYLCFYNSNNNVTTDNLSDIMLNTGSTALPYEPYWK